MPSSLRALALNATALLLLFFGAPAGAEQAVREDGYIVYYVAMPSTSLEPEIARRFGLKRGRGRAILVLNAQREQAQGLPTPVPASGIGEARSLIGHVQRLLLKPAREGEVHYLIAEFEAVNQEILTLDLLVQPEGAQRPIRLQFQQQFYDD